MAEPNWTGVLTAQQSRARTVASNSRPRHRRPGGRLRLRLTDRERRCRAETRAGRRASEESSTTTGSAAARPSARARSARADHTRSGRGGSPSRAARHKQDEDGGWSVDFQELPTGRGAGVAPLRDGARALRPARQRDNRRAGSAPRRERGDQSGRTKARRRPFSPAAHPGGETRRSRPPRSDPGSKGADAGLWTCPTTAAWTSAERKHVGNARGLGGQHGVEFAAARHSNP